MKISLDRQYEPLVCEFFRKNPFVAHKLARETGRLLLEVTDNTLSPEVRRQIQFHFKYLSLFTWQDSDLDDVIFWEQPHLFSESVSDFATLMSDLEFERIAALEARGFLLAGLLAQGLGLPISPVRKDKPFYRRFVGQRIPFMNWKGQEEALFLFEKGYLQEARIVIVDDLLDTGNSLAATIRGLEAMGATIVGAFALGDVMGPQRRAEFALPVRAFVRPAWHLHSDKRESGNKPT